MVGVDLTGLGPHARIAAVGPLSPRERRVAEALASDPAAAVESTAQQLADRLGVARSTVVRTSQALGYEGYPQLRVALAAELGGRHASTAEAVPGADGVLGALHASITELVEDLPSSLALISERDVQEALTGLREARRVLVVANGLSAPLAADVAMRLTAVGRPAEFVADTIGQQVAARGLAPGDLCLFLTGSGANEATLRSAGAAREAGAGTLALTGFAGSPITRVAERSLVIVPGRRGFQGELQRTSRVALAVFLEGIVTQLARTMPERAATTRGHLLDILGHELGDR